MIPPIVLNACRGRAEELMKEGRPVNKKAAVVILTIWLLMVLLAPRFLISLTSHDK